MTISSVDLVGIESASAVDVDGTAISFNSKIFFRFAYGLPPSVESKFRIGSNEKLLLDAK